MPSVAGIVYDVLDLMLFRFCKSVAQTMKLKMVWDTISLDFIFSVHRIDSYLLQGCLLSASLDNGGSGAYPESERQYGS